MTTKSRWWARRGGARDRSTGCGHTRTHARHRGGDRRPTGSAGRGAVPAVPALLARAELDERPQRPGLRRRHVAPVLPAQPVRHPLGQHELGPRHEHRPRALGGAAARDPADVRRERRRRSRTSSRARSWSTRPNSSRLRHGRGPADGGGLHERLHSGAPDPRGPAGAVARLQPRPRPDLDEVRGQPRLRPRARRTSATRRSSATRTPRRASRTGSWRPSRPCSTRWCSRAATT